VKLGAVGSIGLSVYSCCLRQSLFELLASLLLVSLTSGVKYQEGPPNRAHILKLSPAN